MSSSILTAFFVAALVSGCSNLPPHTGAKEVPFEWPEDAGYKLVIDRKGIRPANSEPTVQTSTTQQTEAEQIIAQQKAAESDNLDLNSNSGSGSTRLNVPASAGVTTQQNTENEEFEQFLAFKRWQENNPDLTTNDAEDFKRWKEWQQFKKIEATTEY